MLGQTQCIKLFTGKIMQLVNQVQKERMKRTDARVQEVHESEFTTLQWTNRINVDDPHAYYN